jgi:hypothetical protein
MIVSNEIFSKGVFLKTYNSILIVFFHTWCANLSIIYVHNDYKIRYC